MKKFLNVFLVMFIVVVMNGQNIEYDEMLSYTFNKDLDNLKSSAYTTGNNIFVSRDYLNVFTKICIEQRKAVEKLHKGLVDYYIRNISTLNSEIKKEFDKLFESAPTNWYRFKL